ncbi:MAG: alpha/beta fold hydrolase, partial [Chloroflexota bacterium]
LTILGIVVGIILIGGLAVYWRFGMTGPTLTSADPAITLAERPCEEWIRGGRCGIVTAPLDYAHPGGETVEVGFVYYPAIGFGTDRELAVQIIGGGPGAPISDQVREVPMWGMRLALHNRALLAIDPRGIGWSTHLECDVLNDEASHMGDPSEVIRTCAEQIGVERIHYSTANTARDFDLGRRALGIQQLDLIGFSYGTNLGPVYASLFPDTVRTLILDGAYPITTFENFQPYYHDAMRRQFTLFCERSGDCDGEDALAALAWVTEELRANPRPVTPPAGQDSATYPNTVVLDPPMLAALASHVPMRTFPDDSTPPAFHLPIIGAVLTTRDEGDWSELEAVATAFVYEDGGAITEETALGSFEENRALLWAIDCPESNAPWSPNSDLETRRQELTEATQAMTPERFAPFTAEEWASRPAWLNYYNECIYWPAPPEERPTELRHELGSWRSDLPVLVFNGDYDMNTTNEHAQLAANQFEHAEFARFKHHGHAVVATSTCAIDLWTEFVTHKSVANPDQCLDAEPITASIHKMPDQ